MTTNQFPDRSIHFFTDRSGYLLPCESELPTPVKLLHSEFFSDCGPDRYPDNRAEFIVSVDQEIGIDFVFTVRSDSDQQFLAQHSISDPVAFGLIRDKATLAFEFHILEFVPDCFITAKQQFPDHTDYHFICRFGDIPVLYSELDVVESYISDVYNKSLNFVASQSSSFTA